MSGFENIKAGLSAERIFTVEEKLTVPYLKTPVLGTPMMIGLMEILCKDMVQPLLPPGYTTVGYEVHINRAHRRTAEGVGEGPRSRRKEGPLRSTGHGR
jgi:predicted thioesterase